MKHLTLSMIALLTLTCADTNRGKEETPDTRSEVPSCEPMLRVQRDVSVLAFNEWASGALALVVCRGTPAEKADLSPLTAWLSDGARAGRIRTCLAGDRQVGPKAMATAAELLPGIRDWCFVVVADI